MKNKMLLAFISVFVLGILYFAYNAFVSTEIEEDMSGLNISTPLISVAYFIEQIGGEHVNVTALLPTDQDYHTIELSPSQVRKLNEADAFFTINTPEEMPLIEKLEGSVVSIFDISKGVTLIPFEEDDHEHEGHDHDHDHGDFDPHLWLGISNMSILAQNITQVLIEFDPENEADYQANLMNLQVRLQALWQKTSEVLSSLRGTEVVVMHSAYGYFLEPFGIKQISLESFQRESTLKQLTTALTSIKEKGIHLLLVQPQYNPEQVNRIAEEMGLVKINFNPIFKDPFKEIPMVLEAIQGAGER